MSVERVIFKLRQDPELKDNIVHWKILPVRPASRTPIPESLHGDLKVALEEHGIDRLFIHQKEALDAVLAGKDIVVATPTASGKTLCYNLPVFHTLLKEPKATALYLFPTKALSQDQVAGIQRMNEHLTHPLKAMTYDGDTPAAMRKIIREQGDVVVSNPYMLHTGIMPNHTRWVRFFQGLAFVVVDEMHTLTGVFGSHFANLIRRLERICRHYGSRPQYILSSATIANPSELASGLIGRAAVPVTEDGSPRGEKHFVFYNPPLVNRELGLRRSGLEEARRLAAYFSTSGIQTLTFCRTRIAVEVMVKYLKDLFEKRGLDTSRVMAYRGGYLPELRRRIEKGLRDGEIDAVVATNALELGIDIGTLDACILTGYPGSVASTLQQAGRSGRKAGPSIAVIVARSNATDQYVIHQPGYILDQAPEAGAIDPDNLVIRVNQMKCAAFELPFILGEEFGEKGDTKDVLEYLERDARILRRVNDKWHWMSRSFPAEQVSLNAGDMDNFVVFDKEERKAIGEVDRPSAMSLIHQGAIYGHQGDQYLIEELDYEKRRALASRVDSDYYTEADLETEIRVHHIDTTRDLGPFQVLLGEIGVTKTATLFKKIRFYTRENLGTGLISLPAETMHTEAFFLILEDAAAIRLRLLEGGRSSAFQSVARLLRRVTPLFVRCDTGDLGVKAEIQSAHFARPAIILFDEVPGGVGLSEAASRMWESIFAAMRSIVGECSCFQGCPACVDPAFEGGREHKAVALEIIELFLSGSA